MSDMNNHISSLIPFIVLLCAVSIALISCNPVEERLLTPDLVEELHAYDLGNNGNASDIRVDFKVRDNLNVLEYRVFVVPEESSGLIGEDLLIRAPRESHWGVTPESFLDEYSVHRLPEDQLDVYQVPVRNDTDYRVLILAVGESEIQVSLYSRILRLKDQGIYSGVYYSSLMGIDSLVIADSNNPDQYTGILLMNSFCGDVQRTGSILFSVTGNLVNDVAIDIIACEPTAGQAVSYRGDGIVRNEINLDLTTTGYDFEGRRIEVIQWLISRR